MNLANVFSRLPLLAAADAAPKDSRGVSFNPRALRPVRFIGTVTLAGLAITALPAILVDPASSISYQKASVSVLIALAVTGVSAVVGFLFGLPRSANPDASAETDSTAGARGGRSVGVARARRGNGSLEQIADWLTKLMLGAGLTQLGELKAQTLTLAGAISNAMGASVAGSKVFGLGVIGLFATCGFLGGYLSTRLLLERLLREEELNLEDMAREAEKKGRELGKQEGREEGQEEGRLEARQDLLHTLNRNRLELHSVSSDAAAQAAAAWEPPGPVTNPDDPQKGRFGGKAEANHRRLSATIAPFGGDDDLFELELRVESTNGTPLAQPVKFFLHDTFEPATTVVAPKAGVAKISLIAWGAFTVGAMTDNGETALELDLADVESAPQAFRER